MRVKDLEEYMRRKIIKKIDVEKEFEQMNKKNKENNDYKNNEKELFKKKQNPKLNENNRNLSLKKEISLNITNSLGIKKIKKNNSNPGNNPLSNILSCGMCQMLIGKKDYKSCSKCSGEYF